MSRRRTCLKMIAAVLAAALACAGCAAQGSSEPVELSVGAVRQVRFVIPDHADVAVAELAAAFAKDVERLSKGAMKAEIVVCPANVQTMQDYDADIMLLRNIDLAQADPIFSMFSMPFLYDDYRHMSSALNSAEVGSVLSQHLADSGMEPLAAIYSGRSWIVSIDRDLRSPADFKDLAIAMRTNSAEKIAIFEAIGARVLPYTQKTVSDLLGSSAEVLLEEGQERGAAVSVDAVEVTLEQAVQIRLAQTLYLVDTSHTIAPVWLVGNTRIREDFSAFEQAVLSEAAAGFAAAYELHYAGQDSALIAQLTANGFVHTLSERGTLAAMIYDSDRYTRPEFFDHKLYRTIQTYA